MSAYAVLEPVLLALAVLASLAHAARALAPGVLARVRRQLVLTLIDARRAAWLRALGRKLAPTPRVAFGAAKPGACGRCDGCGSGARRRGGHGAEC